MKKVMLIFTLLLTVLFTACSDEQASVFQSSLARNGVQQNSHITVSDLTISVRYCKIQNGDTVVDTASLGNKTAVVKYIDSDGKNKKTKIAYSVIDTVPPVINIDEDFIFVHQGDEIDTGSITASDNGQNLTFDVELDTSQLGEHIVPVTSTDVNGNKAVFYATFVVIPQGAEGLVTENYHTGYVFDGVTYIDGYIIVNKTYSVPADYGDGLTDETQSAFDAMQKSARRAGYNIWIKSGYRSFSYQSQLFNNYAARDGVQNAETYSARPGYSEHQTGLAMDLNLVDVSFENSPEFRWLQENCYKYGFVLRFVKGKTDQTGYVYEPWHYRYVGTDLARKLYNDGDWMTIEEYFGITSQY